MGEIRITKNCHDALLYLRDKTHPQMLWIDSICIDQSNIDEANKQVAMMREIYGKAKVVLA